MSTLLHDNSRNYKALVKEGAILMTGEVDTRMKLEYMYKVISRGRHMPSVPCDAKGMQGVVTSIPCIEAFCNRDQSWIKRSKPFLGANQGIKVASELLKSTDQERPAAIWPLTLKIKSLRREWSSDQAQSLPTKNFDCSCKRFNRQHISDYLLVWIWSGDPAQRNSMAVCLCELVHDLCYTSCFISWASPEHDSGLGNYDPIN